MHRIFEYSVYRLRSYRLGLSREISSRPVIIVTVRPKIPPLLRDNLALSLILLLVFLNPLILVNPIHELAYASDRLPRQRFPQTMIRVQAELKSVDGNIIEVTVYLIKHLSVSV